MNNLPTETWAGRKHPPCPFTVQSIRRRTKENAHFRYTLGPIHSRIRMFLWDIVPSWVRKLEHGRPYAWLRRKYLEGGWRSFSVPECLEESSSGATAE